MTTFIIGLLTTPILGLVGLGIYFVFERPDPVPEGDNCLECGRAYPPLASTFESER